MTAQMAAYGRLGGDPKPISTRSGNPMVVASLAVNPGDQYEEALWIGLVAFGRQAEALSRHKQGDLISVAGRMQRNRFESRGEQREQLQIVCDSIVSARSVRPGGSRKKAAAVAAATADDDFDDELPEF